MQCYYEKSYSFLRIVLLVRIKRHSIHLQIVYNALFDMRTEGLFLFGRSVITNSLRHIFFHKSSVKIQNIGVAEILVASTISSGVALQSSSVKSATSSTLRSSVAVRGLPGFGSSLIPIGLSRN